MRRFVRLSLVLGLLLSPGVGRAREGCRTDCQTLSCSLSAARCLLDRSQHRPAKEMLRPLVNQHPQSIELHLLLAKAYLGLGNTVWARRVLYQAAEVHERDCQVRSWLVWIHLQQAELEQASSLLSEPGCPDSDPMRGRWQLLVGTLARYQKKRGDAEAELARAVGAQQLYPEDHDLLQHLRSWAQPDHTPPVTLRLDLASGYTSNGLAGSPVDPPTTPDTVKPTTPDKATPAMTFDLLTLFEPPWGRSVRPVGELSLRGLILTRDSVRDFSHLSIGLRPGLAIGSLRLQYGGQLFLLWGMDKYTEAGARWYYETHRAELEWAATPWLTLLSGVGRSFFREDPRTRTELDGTAGLVKKLWRLSLLAALSLRGHFANHRAYDLFGGTLITSATLPLGPLSLRARFLTSFDIYPDSVGYFNTPGTEGGACLRTNKEPCKSGLGLVCQDGICVRSGLTPREGRKDVLLKGSLEVWSKSWHGLRAGLTYDLSGRLSTMDAYDYVDHRVLLRLRLNLTFDPWAPREAPGPRHVALPYGLSRGDRLEDERIQDLLRQEDAARRGSTCVN